MNEVVYGFSNIHKIESTRDFEDSSYMFNKYREIHSDYYRYCFNPYDKNYRSSDYIHVLSVANSFSLFYSKIQESPESPRYHSSIPLEVLRFMLHEDLSTSEYNTPKRKDGWVLEAMFWTNGLLYQLRENLLQDFETFEIGLIIEPVTAQLMQLPKP